MTRHSTACSRATGRWCSPITAIRLIHRLTYRCTNHGNFHVHGFIEEGTTTTPFDLCVPNRLDRYHMAQAALQAVPGLGARGEHAEEALRDALAAHRVHVCRPGMTCRRSRTGPGRTGMATNIPAAAASKPT